jgi:ABC-type multidrug transport system fused ATPase/permease subunit
MERTHAGFYRTARILAFADGLTVLALILILGLILNLLATRGIAWVSPADAQHPPVWLASQMPRNPDGAVVLENTGLYPIVASNSGAASPWPHRLASRLTRSALYRIRPLRGNLGALLSLLCVGLGLVLAMVFIRQSRRRIAIISAQSASSSLRFQLHRQVYRLGQTALPTEAASPVLNLFAEEVNDIRDGLLADTDLSVFAPTVGIGLFLIAVGVSLPLSVFFISLLGITYLLARHQHRAARSDGERASRDAKLHLSLLQEDLGMLRTVRVYGIETVDKGRFEEHLSRLDSAESRRLATVWIDRPINLLLGGAAGSVAIGLLGYVVLDGGLRRVSISAALLMIVCLAGMGRAALLWQRLRRVIRRAGKSAGPVFEFLEKKSEIPQAVGAQFLAPLRDRITLENVSLSDAEGRPILVGVSAEFRSGTRTALVGMDDDAKYALACLIPRLIDPKVGRVRIDGRDLRDVTLESLRAQVALVLQADLIFSDSVFANIGLGDSSFELPRVVEAAKATRAHHFIQELPDGYDTVIGPFGHPLTVDQQYRVALARAYLHDPSIVVVEEPTAHLSDDAKQMNDAAIDSLSKGRTMIFLPHRRSTTRGCDQVILLHNGRVETAGAYRDLQDQSKLFRHLQYMEFNKFATGEMEVGQMTD